MQSRTPVKRSRTFVTFLSLLMLSLVRVKVSNSLQNVALRDRRRAGHLAGNLDDLIGDLLENPSIGTRPSDEVVPQESVCLDGWKTIDWDSVCVKPTHATASPVDVKLILDRTIHIKRDDQLRLPGSHISGNKARKMLSLNSLDPFPRCVVSYGGPQSNAMVALGAVVHFQNRKLGFLENDEERRRFVYFTKSLPRFLRRQPSGNLFRARMLGMELIELPHKQYNDLFGGDLGASLSPPPLLNAPDPAGSFWIPRGGSFEGAIPGTRQLAKEILTYWERVGDDRPLSVVLPGGTCSTAALLHWAIKESKKSSSNKADVQVVVIPCVGDASYARRQMCSLYSQLNLRCDVPLILSPSPSQDDQADEFFTFAEPSPPILETFTRMRDENDLVLDLLYGAPSWTILLRHLRPDKRAKSPLSGREIMYVHSGGLEGINSQLLRYKYKGLIDIDDIQLPGKPGDQLDST